MYWYIDRLHGWPSGLSSHRRRGSPAGLPRVGGVAAREPFLLTDAGAFRTQLLWEVPTFGRQEKTDSRLPPLQLQCRLGSAHAGGMHRLGVAASGAHYCHRRRSITTAFSTRIWSVIANRAAEERLPALHATVSVAADVWGGFFPPSASETSLEQATFACAVRCLNIELNSRRCPLQCRRWEWSGCVSNSSSRIPSVFGTEWYTLWF